MTDGPDGIPGSGDIHRSLRELDPGVEVILRLADGGERRGIFRGFDRDWVQVDDERIPVGKVEDVLLESVSEGPE